MTARILVVDDDLAVLNMVASFLSAEGYSVDKAEDAAAARDLMESTDYGIVVVDKNMPGIDGDLEGGMELLRLVRARHESAEVIMMTGYPTVETAIEAMKLGAFDYIHKPFLFEDLKRKVRRLAEYRRLINPDYTFKIYRTMREEALKLIANNSRMPDDELDGIIERLNGVFDKICDILKESQRILLLQRESLANIASLAEQLKTNTSGPDSSNGLVEEIYRLACCRL
jgi:DNA-binding NtrC family response regulator